MAKEQKPTEKKFVPGWLFGRSLFDGEHLYSKSRSDTASDIQLFRSVERTSKQPGHGWDVIDTDLEEYASPLTINFKNYLQEKIKHAKEEGRKLRILDVGTGTGKQWLGFLKENDIELHLTGLTKSIAHPEIRDKFRISSAAKIHALFPQIIST